MATEPDEFPKALVGGLLEMVRAFDAFRLRYALIGGLAAGYRSRPRFTRDVDFLLEVPQLVLPGLLDDLARRTFSFDRDTVIREWTQEHFIIANQGQLDLDLIRSEWQGVGEPDHPAIKQFEDMIDRYYVPQK